MHRYLILIICYLIFSSHELFLKTDAFFIDPGQETELYLFNGSFDNSENIITRDRIVNAKVVGGGKEMEIPTDNYWDKDEATFLRIGVGAEGTYMAGISTLPRILEMSAGDFKDYLVHEGLSDLVSERARNGNEDQSAREKYSKHVKCLLQVGETHSADYEKILGYPIEFIPLSNPYAMKVGDALSMRLLYKGEPLANEVVRTGYKTNGKVYSGKTVRTNEEGICSIDINSPGKWYAATIHIHESDEGELDYESNWATLTFALK
ncbi:MAG: DUF4198 domain-containing protein [Saprospiraceae bacterium]|nr:DUF4198 domain-containing protein [Saprospiraceae bacterium]